MKKLIFFVSLLGSVLLTDFFTGGEYCSYSCIENYDGLFFNIAFFLSLINAFLLILVFTPKIVEIYWWKFARIVIPIVFILSVIINLKLHHSPYGEFQNILDGPALVLLYSIFVIGSLVAIFIGWRKTR